MSTTSRQASDDLVHRIIQAAHRVHSALGPGFVESIYNRALVVELKSGDFRIERERLIKIWYGSQLVGKHYLDLVVNDELILELKAGRGIIPVHNAQMKSYLHATRYRCGLILNFGMPKLEWEIISGES